MLKKVNFVHHTMLTKDQAPYIVDLAKENVLNKVKEIGFEKTKELLLTKPFKLVLVAHNDDPNKYLVSTPNNVYSLYTSVLDNNNGNNRELLDIGFGNEKELTNIVLSNLPKSVTGIKRSMNLKDSGDVMYSQVNSYIDSENVKFKGKYNQLKEKVKAEKSNVRENLINKINKDLTELVTNYSSTLKNTSFYKEYRYSLDTVVIKVKLSDEYFVKYMVIGANYGNRVIEFVPRLVYNEKDSVSNKSLHSIFDTLLEKVEKNITFKEEFLYEYSNKIQQSSPLFESNESIVKRLLELNVGFVNKY